VVTVVTYVLFFLSILALLLVTPVRGLVLLPLVLHVERRRRQRPHVRGQATTTPAPTPAGPNRTGQQRRWRVEVLYRFDDTQIRPIGSGVVTGPWHNRAEAEQAAWRDLMNHVPTAAAQRVGVRCRLLR
jgi:predicted cobalt transporter CbtA